jgi:hypothetical protein
VEIVVRGGLRDPGSESRDVTRRDLVVVVEVPSVCGRSWSKPTAREVMVRLAATSTARYRPLHRAPWSSGRVMVVPPLSSNGAGRITRQAVPTSMISPSVGLQQDRAPSMVARGSVH